MSTNMDIEQTTEFLKFVLKELKEFEDLEDIKDKIAMINEDIKSNPKYYYKDGLKRYIEALHPEKRISPKMYSFLKSLEQSSKLRETARRDR
jgi:hypothetical protein